MKVKIGDNIYDGSKVPVMVILTDKDKENIKNMPKDATKYACYPDPTQTNYINRWMMDE